MGQEPGDGGEGGEGGEEGEQSKCVRRETCQLMAAPHKPHFSFLPVMSFSSFFLSTGNRFST